MSLSNDPEHRRGDKPCGFALRPLTHADIPAVREIDRLSFAAGDQYDAPFYERVASSPQFEAAVAVGDDGVIVGWVLADLSRRPIRIRSVSVHPDCRRHGLGAALISLILTRHRTETDLLVERENGVAIAFYRRLDFFEVGPDPELPERLRMLWLPAKST